MKVWLECSEIVISDESSRCFGEQDNGEEW